MSTTAEPIPAFVEDPTKEKEIGTPPSKPHHFAPLLLPLAVLSGSIFASGSCGSAFIREPQHVVAWPSSSSQNSPYRIEAFAPTSTPATQVASAKSRPVFDPLAPLDPDAPAQIEDPYNSLAPFFEDLRKAEAKRPDGRVLLAQFGDSHTVADFGTSKLRRLMQERFGDAGRGFVLPGRPFRGYFQRDLFSWSEGPWSVENGFRKGVGAREPFGLGGFRSVADTSKAVAFVGTCKDENCPSGSSASRFEIFYRVIPNGGSLRVNLDDEVKEVFDTNQNASGEETIGGYWSIDLPEGQHQMTLRPSGNGPVELFGVVMERNAPGVVVDALGVGGSHAWHLDHWDWDYIGEHLQRRKPSLVMVAYGTNESASPSMTRERIIKSYSSVISKIKEAMPGVPILIIGPIDRSVRERDDCERYAKSPDVPEGCLWKTPAIIPEIISGQREAALLSGVAFFDMYRAMGGSGTMAQWATQEPQLGQRDRIHLTKSGYEYNAKLLYEALMVAYESYLQSAPPL